MKKTEISDSMKDILVATASDVQSERVAATQTIAEAMEVPLRKVILSGDILNGLFETMDYTNAKSTPRIPLDVILPGTEKEFAAYCVPKQGDVPQRFYFGDDVMVPTYKVANTAYWLLDVARDAQWDIVGRIMEIFEAGFVKKMNDDAWHVILAALVDRNIIVSDGDAAGGLFTKRLISEMKTVMRRQGGGNAGSVNRYELNDLFLSPEAMEDVRNWNIDQVTELLRNQILQSDGYLTRIMGVNLNVMDELGEGQEYQKYFTDVLGGSLAGGGDLELVVGVRRGNFGLVMPVKESLTVREDTDFRTWREGRAGVYGKAEMGFACLNNLVVLAGSF